MVVPVPSKHLLATGHPATDPPPLAQVPPVAEQVIGLDFTATLLRTLDHTVGALEGAVIDPLVRTQLHGKHQEPHNNPDATYQLLLTTHKGKQSAEQM